MNLRRLESIFVFIARLMPSSRAPRLKIVFNRFKGVLQTVKNKNNGFASHEEFVRYVEKLIQHQQGPCAITGMPIRADGDQIDGEDMLASLDRSTAADTTKLGIYRSCAVSSIAGRVPTTMEDLWS